MGELLAITVSLDKVADYSGNKRAELLAKTLDLAIGKILEDNKSPSPRTGELDSRGSHFYLAMYWAQELSGQTEDAELAVHFSKLAKSLTDNEDKIIQELNSCQGEAVDIGGYFFADPVKTTQVMHRCNFQSCCCYQAAEYNVNFTPPD